MELLFADSLRVRHGWTACETVRIGRDAEYYCRGRIMQNVSPEEGLMMVDLDIKERGGGEDRELPFTDSSESVMHEPRARLPELAVDKTW